MTASTPRDAPEDRDGLAVQITGVGCALPDRLVTSEEVEERIRAAGPNARIPKGLIERTTGVRTRRFRADGQDCSDLAVAAAEIALDRAGITEADVDALIFAAASQDLSEPATASIVQEKLGCTAAYAFDVKNACASFVNGLDIAHSLVQTGRAGNVLVVNGEVLSITIDWQLGSTTVHPERFAALTLGDGGAAAVVAPAKPDSPSRLHRAELYSDGTHWRASVVRGGGSMHWGDPTKHYFECDSAALARAAAFHLPGMLDRALARVGWERSSIDAVIPHQVSIHHREFFGEHLSMPPEIVEVIVGDYGNIAAASIPIALTLAVEAGRITRGDRVVLMAGAAGFSAGVTPLVW